MFTQRLHVVDAAERTLDEYTFERGRGGFSLTTGMLPSTDGWVPATGTPGLWLRGVAVRERRTIAIDAAKSDSLDGAQRHGVSITTHAWREHVVVCLAPETIVTTVAPVPTQSLAIDGRLLIRFEVGAKKPRPTETAIEWTATNVASRALAEDERVREELTSAAVAGVADELREASEHARQSGQRRIGQPSRTRVIVLVTATEKEKTALHRVFTGQQVANQYLPTRGPIPRRLYYDLGRLDGCQLLHIHASEMGPLGTHGGMPSALAAIQDWSPVALFAVGIAFGIDPQNQAMNDVLVSSRFQDYSVAAVRCQDPAGPTHPITFEHRMPSQPGLGMGTKTVVDDLATRWRNDSARPNVYAGPYDVLLTGPFLVKCRHLRDALRAALPGAIGGEMEAAGVLNACAMYPGVVEEYGMFKAICDWGDHTKSDLYQKSAAETAASFAHELIELLAPRL